VHGYVIYRQRSDWDITGPKGVVTVLEVAALDAVAEQALWRWLFSIDLIGIVRCWRGPAPHPLQLMVTEPAAWRSRSTTARGCGSSTWRAPSGANLPRRYARDRRDRRVLPSNAGRWELSAPADGEGSGARARWRAPRRGGDRSELDISDPATVYLGPSGSPTWRRQDASGNVGRWAGGGDALFSTPQRRPTRRCSRRAYASARMPNRSRRSTDGSRRAR
jgi:hypothetical protein